MRGVGSSPEGWYQDVTSVLALIKRRADRLSLFDWVKVLTMTALSGVLMFCFGELDVMLYTFVPVFVMGVVYIAIEVMFPEFAKMGLGKREFGLRSCGMSSLIWFATGLTVVLMDFTYESVVRLMAEGVEELVWLERVCRWLLSPMTGYVFILTVCLMSMQLVVSMYIANEGYLKPGAFVSPVAHYYRYIVLIVAFVFGVLGVGTLFVTGTHWLMPFIILPLVVFMVGLLAYYYGIGEGDVEEVQGHVTFDF